jgi:hypothetical protein
LTSPNAAVIRAKPTAVRRKECRDRPRLLSAAAFGMIFGFVLEVVIVNLIVNQVQEIDTLYTSKRGARAVPGPASVCVGAR